MPRGGNEDDQTSFGRSQWWQMWHLRSWLWSRQDVWSCCGCWSLHRWWRNVAILHSAMLAQYGTKETWKHAGDQHIDGGLAKSDAVESNDYAGRIITSFLLGGKVDNTKVRRVCVCWQPAHSVLPMTGLTSPRAGTPYSTYPSIIPSVGPSRGTSEGGVFFLANPDRYIKWTLGGPSQFPLVIS